MDEKCGLGTCDRSRPGPRHPKARTPRPRHPLLSLRTGLGDGTARLREGAGNLLCPGTVTPSLLRPPTQAVDGSHRPPPSLLFLCVLGPSASSKAASLVTVAVLPSSSLGSSALHAARALTSCG